MSVRSDQIRLDSENTSYKCICEASKSNVGLFFYTSGVHFLVILQSEEGAQRLSRSCIECLTWDREAVGSSLTGVTALWSLSKNIYPSLVLVKPRKTRPCLTERLLMGRKDQIKQTNKQKPRKIHPI